MLDGLSGTLDSVLWASENPPPLALFSGDAIGLFSAGGWPEAEAFNAASVGDH